CPLENQTEDDEKTKRHECKHRVEAKQPGKSNDRSKDSADELDKARSHQIPNPFDIGHDSRNKCAGLVRIVITNRKPPDMLLHADSHIRYKPLCRCAQKVNEGV